MGPILAGLLAGGSFALGVAGANEPLTRVPSPVFSVPGGVFSGTVKLVLTAPQATVRYTLDGAEPDETSRMFSGPLTLTNCTLVRARSFVRGLPPSPTVSHAYTVLAEDLVGFASDLPLVLLNTYGEEISGDARIVGAVRVINRSGARAVITGPADYEGRSMINLRGHASRRYPKHSFTLRTLDELDDKRAVSILGLPRENDWVLYGPYVDKSLIRDVLGYELSRRTGQWAPRTRCVELFLNEGRTPLGNAHYFGVYILEERVTRDKQRVNVKRIEPDDLSEPAITGGYLIKKDHVGRGPRVKAQAERLRNRQDVPAPTRMALPTGPGGFPGDPAGFLPQRTNPPPGAEQVRRFVRSRRLAATLDGVEPVTNYVGFLPRAESAASRREGRYPEAEIAADPDGFRTGLQGIHYYYVEPEPDEITAVQRAWLSDHFNEFERALYGPDFKDPVRGYRAYIDPDSFIGQHLLQEVTKNVDGFRFSAFFHKDRGGPICMGPAWDLNLTFGNARSFGVNEPERWLWPQLDDQGYSYFRRLFEDPDFAQRYVDRWAELRAGPWATSNVLAFIDQTAAQLEEAQKRNFERWPILGEEVKPNVFVGTNYASEVEYLRTWVEARLAWIDRQFLPAPAFAVKGSAASRRMELATPLPEAKVHFTLDGTDPRASGGGLSARAAVASDPVDFPEGARLFARVRLGERWSSPVRSSEGER